MDENTNANNEVTLTPEEIAALQTQVSDLTAERDSLKSELGSKNDELANVRAELQKTKELNFTLARQTTVPKQSVEDILNDMF